MKSGVVLSKLFRDVYDEINHRYLLVSGVSSRRVTNGVSESLLAYLDSGSLGKESKEVLEGLQWFMREFFESSMNAEASKDYMDSFGADTTYLIEYLLKVLSHCQLDIRKKANEAYENYLKYQNPEQWEVWRLLDFSACEYERASQYIRESEQRIYMSLRTDS